MPTFTVKVLLNWNPSTNASYVHIIIQFEIAIAKKLSFRLQQFSLNWVKKSKSLFPKLPCYNTMCVGTYFRGGNLIAYTNVKTQNLYNEVAI